MVRERRTPRNWTRSDIIPQYDPVLVGGRDAVQLQADRECPGQFYRIDDVRDAAVIECWRRFDKDRSLSLIGDRPFRIGGERARDAAVLYSLLKDIFEAIDQFFRLADGAQVSLIV